MANEIEKKSDEPVIHVIPEQFYGAALKKQVAPEPLVPKSAPVPPQRPAAPSAPSVPAAPTGAGAGITPPRPAAPPPPASRKKFPLIPVIIAILVLLGGGGAAVFFLTRAPEPAANVNTPTNTSPLASCGDATCDATENADNCPSDCTPPGPVCGDNACESPETYASCAADCPAPAPACGDAACDAGEDATSCPSDCTPPISAPPSPGADSDSDGLTDVEERDIYGTNPLATNSDGDSFVDLNEVLNLFDPSKPEPALLKDSAGISQFADLQSFPSGISLLYPRTWAAARGESAVASDVFTAPTGEKIVLSTAANPDSRPLAEVFLSAHQNLRASDIQSFTTRSGYAAVIGPDRMEAFVQAPDGTVFTFLYSIGSASTLQYKVTFEMMVNSFRL